MLIFTRAMSRTSPTARTASESAASLQTSPTCPQENTVRLREHRQALDHEKLLLESLSTSDVGGTHECTSEIPQRSVYAAAGMVMLGLRQAGAHSSMCSALVHSMGTHLLDGAIAADLGPHLTDAAPCVLRQLRQLLGAYLHSVTLVTVLSGSQSVWGRPVQVSRKKYDILEWHFGHRTCSRMLAHSTMSIVPVYIM